MFWRGSGGPPHGMYHPMMTSGGTFVPRDHGGGKPGVITGWNCYRYRSQRICACFISCNLSLQRLVYPTHIGQSAQVVAVRFYYWYIMRSFPVAGSSKKRTFCKDLDDAVTSRNVKKDESESWLSVEFLCVGHTRQPYYHNKTTSHARDPWIRPSSTFAAW